MGGLPNRLLKDMKDILEEVDLIDLVSSSSMVLNVIIYLGYWVFTESVAILSSRINFYIISFNKYRFIIVSPPIQ